MGTDVTPIPKPERRKKNGHPWGCPCPSCRGSRNRRKGLKSQRAAAKAAGIERRGWGDLSNEETWSRTGLGAVFALEHKTGRQIPKTVLGWFDQVKRAQALGDLRPAALTFTPEGESEVYFVARLVDVRAALEAAGPEATLELRKALDRALAAIEEARSALTG